MRNTKNETAASAACDELISYCVTMSDEIARKGAERLTAKYRAALLAEAIEAARGEYLQDDTGTSEDEAYNQAVSDVVDAIGALLEGK